MTGPNLGLVSLQMSGDVVNAVEGAEERFEESLNAFYVCLVCEEHCGSERRSWVRTWEEKSRREK